MAKTNNKKHWPPVQLLVALGLFGLAAWLARGHIMLGWEQRIFWKIYNLPAFLHPVFYFITQFGSTWMVLLAGLFWLLKHKEKFALVLLANCAAAYTLVTIAKHIVQRGRPDVLIPGLQAYDPLASGFGFPSGHMAIATTVAFSLWPKVPVAYRKLLILLPLLVGVSRVNLGVHAPLDIVGGFAIGWFVVSVSNRTFTKYIKT